MPGTKSALDKSLQLLYNYSSNFHVSIELIQKLAQQLKLETFIDSLGFNLDDSKPGVKTQIQTQKLSIAGSSILLDIDFETDNKIVGLSLSVNASESIEQQNIIQREIDPDHKNTNGPSSSSHISIDIDELGIHHVKLNCNNNPISFLNKSSKLNDANKTHVEQILLRNLQKTSKLGNFPINLQRLATIDKFTNYNSDLFIYIESIALLFNTIFQIENQLNSNNWEIENGLSNSIGKVNINNEDRLGVSLDFWKDYRFINHEYEIIKNQSQNGILVGNCYTIQVDVVEASKQIDYLLDNQVQEWDIFTNKYKFEFDSNSLKSLILDGDEFLAWSLQFKLNHSIYIPVYVLEYFSLRSNNYTLGTGDHDSRNVFGKINEGESFEQSLNIDCNSNSISSSFQLINDIPGKFVPLKSFQINKLVDISKLIPILRNFLVLINLCRTVIKSKLNQLPIFNSKGGRRRRRSSRFLGIPTTEKELTEEFKLKLKESLKLPDDVTDEEILGLSAISETANYSTIPPTNKDDIDLESFLENEDNTNNNSGENDGQMNDNDVDANVNRGIEFPENGNNYFLLKLENIDLTSRGGDLQLAFEAQFKSQEIYIPFRISNGEIVPVQNNDDMETDDTLSSKFIKALNLTEDIISSYKAVYSN